MSYNTGIRLTQEIYELRIKQLHNNIVVLGKYVNTITAIKHMCTICNYEWSTKPTNLLNGSGCPCCGKKVIGNPPNYKNSIWTSKYKNIIGQYLTEEQQKTYMPYSNRPIIATCPNCNTKKNTTPAILIRRGLKCQGCSDGISYPNKFIRALLRQIPDLVNVKYEYSPDWLVVNKNKCFFDVYFEYLDNSYIIEMDGNIGHGNFEFYSKKDTKYGLLKDRQKDALALKHNIHVIRIDSRESSLEYIKNNILHSELNNLLNLDKREIDWIYCHSISLKSLAVEASNLWENGYTVKEISNMLHISINTVRRYLINMSKTGNCTYTVNLARERGNKQRINYVPKGRKVINVDTNEIYDSIKYASEHTGLSYDLIRARCRRKQNWRYYDEFLEQK